MANKKLKDMRKIHKKQMHMVYNEINKRKIETFKIKLNGNWKAVEISRNDLSIEKNGIEDSKLWVEKTNKMIKDIFNTTEWQHIGYKIKTSIRVNYEE